MFMSGDNPTQVKEYLGGFYIHIEKHLFRDKNAIGKYKIQ